LCDGGEGKTHMSPKSQREKKAVDSKHSRIDGEASPRSFMTPATRLWIFAGRSRSPKPRCTGLSGLEKEVNIKRIVRVMCSYCG
jgi:hypothetical protein